jgi:hypothetical protein
MSFKNIIQNWDLIKAKFEIDPDGTLIKRRRSAKEKGQPVSVVYHQGIDYIRITGYDTKRVSIPVHHILMALKKDSPEIGRVRHKNGCKMDNRIENLEEIYIPKMAYKTQKYNPFSELKNDIKSINQKLEVLIGEVLDIKKRL